MIARQQACGTKLDSRCRKRSPGVPDLLAYERAVMAPIAPMAIPGAMFAESYATVVLAYGVGAVAMAFTTVSSAQMVRALPLADSVYNYVGRGIAPSVGAVVTYGGEHKRLRALADVFRTTR
jgi:amino acid transporter